MYADEHSSHQRCCPIPPAHAFSFDRRSYAMHTATATATSDTTDAGKLLLRAVLAILLLFHGISKLQHGIGFIADILAKHGMPAVLGYGVYIGEVVAPLLILIGLFTRAAALVVAINMVVAVLLVHTAQFFTVNDTGGWALELQGMYFCTALAVALMGAGRFSVGGIGGRYN
jgi:putative oxidoreductase